MLNKKQIKILEPYSHHFQTAKLGYIRGIYYSDIQSVLPIYTELGYRLTNPNCGECVLVMFKKLGEIFEKYKIEK
jgi:hypothetical protein